MYKKREISYQEIWICRINVYNNDHLSSDNSLTKVTLNFYYLAIMKLISSQENYNTSYDKLEYMIFKANQIKVYHRL